MLNNRSYKVIILTPVTTIVHTRRVWPDVVKRFHRIKIRARRVYTHPNVKSYSIKLVFAADFFIVWGGRGEELNTIRRDYIVIHTHLTIGVRVMPSRVGFVVTKTS